MTGTISSARMITATALTSAALSFTLTTAATAPAAQAPRHGPPPPLPAPVLRVPGAAVTLTAYTGRHRRHLTAWQRHQWHLAHLAHLRHLRRLQHRYETDAVVTYAGRHRRPAGSPREQAAAMLAGYGWGQGQMGCLDPLWQRESGWNPYAENPSSGAYGIPQAYPGSKMSSAGQDWQTDAATQIRWGLSYIAGAYGSPCAAWYHDQDDGWY